MTDKIPLYQADAFADSLFTGNPAAVCITDTWLRDALMQNIAAENNLSETAFVVPEGMDYGLRWFTPVAEVDLCGHATLAAAYILFRFYIPAANEVRFHSKNSGILTVRREGDVFTLDFPADEIHPAYPPAELLQAFASAPAEILKGNSDYLLVFSSQQEIEEAAPDMSVLLKVPARGIIITAPGKETDFVSRFFGPRVGVPEDPVTGSAHTTLTPYWASRLNKTTLSARQLSKRGGSLSCSLQGKRVEISGTATLYSEGHICLE